MRWRLPREQGRRLAIAATLASLAFLAQGPAFTAASFTNNAAPGSTFTTGTWCGTNIYPATVLALAGGPRNFLRLNETGVVATVADSAAGPPPDGLPSGTGHLWGSTGLLDCSSATGLGMDGTGAPRVRTGGPAITGPNSITLTGWVNIVSGQGRLIGFSRSSVGTSNRYDRMLYVDGAGLLRFGIWNNFTGAAPAGANSIQSDAPVTGGLHHIAATLGAGGMRMYVDGVLQAQTNAVITQGRTGYTGYWRVGWDALPVTWPGVTVASGVPTGTIDEVAIWHSQLSAGQIATLSSANHD